MKLMTQKQRWQFSTNISNSVDIQPVVFGKDAKIIGITYAIRFFVTANGAFGTVSLQRDQPTAGVPNTGLFNLAAMSNRVLSSCFMASESVLNWVNNGSTTRMFRDQLDLPITKNTTLYLCTSEYSNAGTFYAVTYIDVEL